ncbi:MAG: protein kinase [Chloroflexi bacterium]|nr:protein kinase [Chloroflexota bacterium]
MTLNASQLGPYRIETELGHGGMATVYRAVHVPLRRFVALKVLDSLLSRNVEFQQRFEQEATVAARLEHPNIISIYDLGVADGYQYIAMRLIDGPTLEQVIRDEGPLPASRALAIVAQVADALAYAHDQGVYHRDVKPSNIILQRNDHPVLTDFGIARAVEGLRLTMSQSVVGTPRYMSPEQATAQPVDHRSDIYSLGVVLYEMLSGQPPFNAGSTPSLLYMHVHELPPPLSRSRPDLSAGVRELVDRSLAKSPDDRFQSASQVVASCRALLAISDLDNSSRTVMLPAQPRPPSETPRPYTPPSAAPYSANPSGFVPPAEPRTHTPAPAAQPQTPAAYNRPPAPETVASMPGAAAPPAVATPPPGGVAASPPKPRPRLSRLGLAGIGAGVVLLAALAFFAVDRLPGRSSPVVAAPTPRETALPTATAMAAGGPIVAAAQPTQPAALPVAASPATVGSSGSAAVQQRLADVNAALGRKDWAAALDQVTIGLQAAPRDPALLKAAVQAHIGYGEQLWSQGKLDEAMVHYLVVREQPLRPAASPTELREAELAAPYLWAELTWKLDQVIALAEYEKAYRLDPSFRDVKDKVYSAYITLAGQQAQQGNRDTALGYLTKARGVDPSRPEADAMMRTLTPGPSR